MHVNRRRPQRDTLLTAALLGICLAAAMPFVVPAPAAAAAEAREELPPGDPPFRGVIGRTIKESKASFPQPVQAPRALRTS